MSARSVFYIASTFSHVRSFHIPYLQWMIDHGMDVSVLAHGDPYGLPEGLSCHEVPFEKSYIGLNNLRAARRVADLVRTHRPDVCITHTSLAAFFARLGVGLAGKHDMGLINVVHGYLFDENDSRMRKTVMSLAEKLVAPLTDRAVVMNEQDLCIARRYHVSRYEPLLIHGMGIDPRFLSVNTHRGLQDTDNGGSVDYGTCDRMRIRCELGLPEEAYILIYAAEFSTRKNHRMLIEALPQLPASIVLVCPGQGELYENCQRLAAELGVQERYIAPGYVGNPEMWYAASDLCVSASRYEGLPFHVMEAMASGLACVASDIKGHQDLLGPAWMDEPCPGVAGLLYPYNKVESYVECVLRFFESCDFSRQCARNARHRAKFLVLERVKDDVLHAMDLDLS